GCDAASAESNRYVFAGLPEEKSEAQKSSDKRVQEKRTYQCRRRTSMKTLAPEAFQVKDGEVITIDVKSTIAATLFGVNHSIFGGGFPLKEGVPLKVTMDKSKAQGNSTVPNAKSTPLT